MMRAGLARRRSRCLRVSPGSSCASTARLTWHAVHSGFFPPQDLVRLGQEQEADGGEDQVSLERPIVSNFEVIQSDLTLVVLEAALDVPAGKGDLKDRLQGAAGGGVGDEILGISAQ